MAEDLRQNMIDLAGIAKGLEDDRATELLVHTLVFHMITHDVRLGETLDLFQQSYKAMTNAKQKVDEQLQPQLKSGSTET
jgi:hypothetical protein